MTDSSLLRVLRLLDASPSRTQRAMATELGMSLGKANYVLRALLAKGFVKVQNFSSNPNKRGYAYLLTPEGVAAKADLTRQYMAMKMREYEELKAEIEKLKQENGEVVGRNP